MADTDDNVNLSGAADTFTAASKYSGGAHYQVMILADGTTVTRLLTIDANGAASVKGAANSGVDIGDVDVTSVVPGTSATSLGKAEDAAHTTADTGVAMLAVRRNSAAVGSDTDGDYSTVNVDGSGRLWTHDPVAEALLTTIDADTSGLFGCVGGTELQVDIVGSLPAGSAAIGKLAANSGVDIGDVDVTSISAGSNLIGDVAIQGRTSGGLSWFRSIDIDESEEEVKGSAGQLYSILAFNRTADPRYLKIYDGTAAGIAVGSDTPKMTFVVPGNSASDGAGFVFNTPIGIAFTTGITVACTTAVADSDTGAPGANDVIVNIGYK